MELVEAQRTVRVVTVDIRNLQKLVARTSTIYPALQEAAEVMLFQFSHKLPAEGTWGHDDGQLDQLAIVWNEPTQDALETHTNELDATEEAAYAIAIATVSSLGFRVLGRIHHGSGADWVMIRCGEPANDYYKLEVSGIARQPGNPQHRLTAKIGQVRGGDYNRPGVAFVARLQDLAVLSASTQ